MTKHYSPLIPELRPVDSYFEDSVITTYEPYNRKELLDADDYKTGTLIKAGLNPDSIVSISGIGSGCRADSFSQFNALAQTAEQILTPPTGDMPENI